MEFKLQTLRFNATEKLVAFIDKKIAKLEKYGEVQNVELTFRSWSPKRPITKRQKLHVVLPGRSIHTEKVADTFEEAVDLCIDVARRELAENKENHGWEEKKTAEKFAGLKLLPTFALEIGNAPHFGTNESSGSAF